MSQGTKTAKGCISNNLRKNLGKETIKLMKLNSLLPYITYSSGRKNSLSPQRYFNLQIILLSHGWLSFTALLNTIERVKLAIPNTTINTTMFKGGSCWVIFSNSTQ